MFPAKWTVNNSAMNPPNYVKNVKIDAFYFTEACGMRENVVCVDMKPPDEQP